MLNRKWQQSRLRGAVTASGMALVLAVSIAISGCDMLGTTSGTTGNNNPTGTAVIAQVAPTNANAPQVEASATATTPAGPTDTLPPAATATQTPIPPSPTPQPRALNGKVTDQYSGKPITNAQVSAAGVLTGTNDSGEFYFEDVPDNAQVNVEATGYASAQMVSGSGASVNITLIPTSIKGRITDKSTGKPVYGAIVRIDLPGGSVTDTTTTASPVVTGTIAPASTETVAPTGTITTTGRLPGLAAAPAQADQPTSTAGAVDATATGVVTATIAAPTATSTPAPIMPTPTTTASMILGVTDADGNYSLDNVPPGVTMTVKMPGYKVEKVTLGQGVSGDVAMTPFVAKALYITAPAAGYQPLFDPIMQLINTTELNAVVINIQDDAAQVVYPTNVQMAKDSNAVDLMLPNMKDLIDQFHKQGIYVIARMTTFMQPKVADSNPDLAVISAATGKPWIGGELSSQRWLDPTNPKAQEYPLALMMDAVKTLGADEIQFDYIRFPSDPAPGEKWDNMRFSQPADDTTKQNYISGFLKRAHDMLNATDAFMSIDVFGYTIWPDQNGQPLNASIGQVAPKMIPYTDYISPMIYPSHFSAGEQGFSDPNAHPGEIVAAASKFTMERLQGQRALYRPWLQGFDWNHVVYDGPLMRAQIDAVESGGAKGWMFWDPSNVYYNGFKSEP